ncbi:tail fiber protein (plasmid) [Roseomonas marmotae]|uniref:phage tail protein n=1 Tax=Roseomonas marmotae TaxID=2768161 RepID=UPI001AD6F48D|nr:phage tail protein [Roseomonas marmotae]QTI81487.1 tail fiber protein [Roseomonas marmotae]
MGNIVQVKRSSVAGKVPLAADLEVGEIAVNLADGKIFTKDGSGNILELGLANCVRFDTAQELTDAQKKQARSNIDAASDDTAPVGSYIYFAGSFVPDHYLLCNGAAVSRTDYADLYAVIGNTYGAGDGSTTFNLPNAIDKFLEGSGTSGTEIAAGLPDITGYIGGVMRVHYPSGAVKQDTTFNNFANTGTQGGQEVSLKASNLDAIFGNSATVQPPALTALPCIRYE